MTRRVEVGTLPRANEIFADGRDPLTVMIDAANAELDRQRDDEERARQAALADVERTKRTRSSLTARRLRKALKMFARLR
jgi:hypothetical protein